MATETFKKSNTKIYVKHGLKTDPDDIFWRNYTGAVLVKEFGPIDHIDFSPVEPYNFAVTCSCRVQIYDSVTRTTLKNLNKFKKNAYGASFRSDGRLLCAGSEEAVIRLFDVNSKSLLRIFSDHKAAVHRTFFASDGTHLVSFSDDKTTAVWDIPTEKRVISFNDHSEYVRAGSTSPISPTIFLSGGYDGMINMCDSRTAKNIMRVSHETPVQSLCFLPNGGIFVSAGGHEIKVWDSLSGGRLLARISQHHKVVTCLQIACNGRRIISGSLDKTVKVYDSASFRLLHSIEYPNPILSVDISINDEVIVAGMTDGMISVRRNETISNGYALGPPKMIEGPNEKSLGLEETNLLVNPTFRESMSKHDIFLRKFEYSRALDSALVNYIVNKSPHITVAVFRELIRRQGLIQALVGRYGRALGNIIKFISRHVGSIMFGSTLLIVATTIMDTYRDQWRSMDIDLQTIFVIFQRKLKEEKNLASSLLELYGMIGIMRLLEESTAEPVNSCSHAFNPSGDARGDFIMDVP